jgi:hypothetical protein
MPTTVLVACCGKKLVGKHAAKDIYQSQLFRKARAWAERHGDDWFILSAKYGVVAPDDQIDTYDLALNTTSREYRLEWAGRVATKLRDVAKGRLVVLAGENYCQAWPEHFQFVERPLKGLGIGKQLAWLTQSEGLPPRSGSRGTPNTV